MQSAARSWTITTWNIHGAARPDITAIAARIESESPDVVALQETRRGQADELAKQLGMRYTWALKHYPYTPLLRGAAEGLAILTPHALDAAGHSEVSKVRRKWTYKRRIMQFCLVGRPDSSAYRIYNLHLSPGEVGADRRAEAVAATELIAQHGDVPPAIVAGDLNDDTDPSIVFALPGIEHLVPSPTHPAHAPHKVIDHVLLPAEARNVSTTVPAGASEWAELSDHLPVTVRFDMDWVQGDFT